MKKKIFEITEFYDFNFKALTWGVRKKCEKIPSYIGNSGEIVEIS